MRHLGFLQREDWEKRQRLVLDTAAHIYDAAFFLTASFELAFAPVLTGESF
ncbi:MAG: hypothetical protein ACR2LR_12475 [Hassallia sp.]